MNWYLTAFKKYAVFSGRSRRKEFWIFSVINTLIYALLAFLEFQLNSPGYFMLAFTLIIFIPSIAVTIRRLHDTSRSGWWFLIYAIPVVGPLIILFFMAKNSTEEENDFGQNPKLS